MSELFNMAISEAELLASARALRCQNWADQVDYEEADDDARKVRGVLKQALSDGVKWPTWAGACIQLLNEHAPSLASRAALKEYRYSVPKGKVYGRLIGQLMKRQEGNSEMSKISEDGGVISVKHVMDADVMLIVATSQEHADDVWIRLEDILQKRKRVAAAQEQRQRCGGGQMKRAPQKLTLGAYIKAA